MFCGLDEKPEFAENGNIRINWAGTVRFLNHSIGRQSILAFAEDERSFAQKCMDLKGIFALEYQRGDEKYIITDYRGDYPVYIHDNRAYFSLLRLLEDVSFSFDSLDLDSITDIMLFGNLRGCPIRGIRRLEGDQIYSVSDGRLIKKKWHDPISEGGDPDSLEDLFFDMIDSLPHRISLDLTGGLDSRLSLSFILRKGIEFECAITGRDDLPDVLIAKELARKFNFPLYHYEQTIEDVIEDIPSLLDLSDGISNPINYQRRYRMNLGRKDRGIDILISSFGPTKDAYWSFFWPFINHRRLNLDFYYRSKIAPKKWSDLFKDSSLETNIANFDRRQLSKLENLRREPAARFADAIGFYTMETTHHMKMDNTVLKSVYPFLEDQILHAIQGYSFRDRYNHRYFRKYVPRYSRELAEVPTNLGMNTSDRSLKILEDELRQLFRTLGKIGRRIRYKITGKRTSPNVDGLSEALLETDLVKESIKLIKAKNLINTTDIPPHIIGNLLPVAEIIKRLK